ncbi:carboxyl transferase domain-containing protein [Roseiarcus sp.]|uniref:carboxyl transferase domain-containing protein n=1 Tax=Roseiarcus sp. TaxID=1969460 RepID=UPI003F9BABDD
MSDAPFRKLLIANRGEVAVRIARAAADLQIASVAIYSEDDAASLHLRKADEAHALGRAGVAAYLDGARIVALAKATGCDAIHPGYGFLAENAGFARAVAAAGITFIGASPEALDMFGDKLRARDAAARAGAPVIEGAAVRSVEAARAFFMGVRAPILLKAVAGGGGRGMRSVRSEAEIAEAFARCQSEAANAFGDGSLYAERLIESARHIEVQILGDRRGGITHFGERECTIQRRSQKLIEVAPSPSLNADLRERIVTAAMRIARAASYDSLGTFEFLVDAADRGDDAGFAFIEANPRLQVEHTVTEEVFGVDLAAAQICVAAGASLAELGLDAPRAPRGYAIQARVNLETMTPAGGVLPSGGRIAAFDLPSGPGVRVDTFGYSGYRTVPAFDSLIAKVIVHSQSPDFSAAAGRLSRALGEFRVAGVETNIPFLQAVLTHPDFVANRVDTRFIERRLGDLLQAAGREHRALYYEGPETDAGDARAGALEGPEGTVAVAAPLQGTVVSVDVSDGDTVRPGQQIAVLEAMKMEHLVAAPAGGVVRETRARKGDTLYKDDAILFLEPADVDSGTAAKAEAADPDAIRPDLADMLARQAFGFDANRPKAVAKRRQTNHRTARENIAALVDPGSFIEYGSLAVAAQAARRSREDLIRNTPGDGVVAGLATVNGDLFDADRARCLVVAYDYTVLAGTQGARNHKKQDRLFQRAEKQRLPIVLFAEGGGGRPGDTEGLGVTGLDVPTFAQFAALSGLAPLVGVASGRCFAGNAALLGCCDVVIATKDSSIGMGGPAMIEGGGLGVVRPDEVGPISTQAPNGVVDVVAEDEIEAAAAAKKYLSYFQGRLPTWAAPDQRRLRRAIPENRLRVYEIRTVIETLADEGSVLELRAAFGLGVVTALVRIEGRPLGLIANNPKHLGGAIDADAADKAARFLQLCDAYDLPVVSLCDTPGFMVGPEAEKTALVRHVCRMFVTAASLTIPYFTVVLRKGYGLGAQAMAGGGFHAQCFTVSWPTGEFGGMGLEGAVRLGFRKELEAIEDAAEREKLFRTMVAKSYETGKATNIASVLEIDQVIDPLESRRWILRGLDSCPTPPRRETRKRPCVDTW